MLNEYQSLLLPASPTRLMYTLEIGVDKPAENGGTERVCAVEAGPWMRMMDARKFAMQIQGQPVAELLDLPFVEAYDLPEAEIRDVGYTVAGVTLNTYSDAGGTTGNVDLY